MRVETIAHAGDPSFVTRALGDALGDADAQGRVAEWLAAALDNPAVNTQVWQFVKSRWSDLQPTLSAPFARSSIVAAAGAFCDGAMRDDVARFFEGKPGTPPQTLRLALDRIDACRDRRLRFEKPVADWLAAQRFVPEP